MTMTTWTIEIPDWLPTPLNVLMRMNRHARNRLLKAEARLIAGYAYVAGVPNATGRRRVTLRLTLGPRDKVRDDDGQWKSLLDALVKAALLIDDSPAWVERGPLEQVPGAAKATAILLEDLP